MLIASETCLIAIANCKIDLLTVFLTRNYRCMRLPSRSGVGTTGGCWSNNVRSMHRCKIKKCTRRFEVTCMVGCFCFDDYLYTTSKPANHKTAWVRFVIRGLWCCVCQETSVTASQWHRNLQHSVTILHILVINHKGMSEKQLQERSHQFAGGSRLLTGTIGWISYGGSLGIHALLYSLRRLGGGSLRVSSFLSCVVLAVPCCGSFSSMIKRESRGYGRAGFIVQSRQIDEKYLVLRDRSRAVLGLNVICLQTCVRVLG